MAASFAQQSLQLGWRRMSRLLSAQEEVSRGAVLRHAVPCCAVLYCAILALQLTSMPTGAVGNMP